MLHSMNQRFLLVPVIVLSITLVSAPSAFATQNEINDDDETTGNECLRGTVDGIREAASNWNPKNDHPDYIECYVEQLCNPSGVRPPPPEEANC